MTPLIIPLEDELGDVLEKAMRHAGLGEEALAASTGVAAGKIRDAINYRSELTSEEMQRLAAALGLNEVGFCVLGSGQYPSPEIGALPFCVWPLRMAHGIGVVNAYVVAECGASRGMLFDTGAGLAALEAVWPAPIRQLEAVFLTHVEAEHAGGLCGVVGRFGGAAAFIPRGAIAACGGAMGEGETKAFGAFEVTAFTTPGHAAAHNCYLVRAPAAKHGRGLLISGDLIFAGSAGAGYFCHVQLQANLRRVMAALPEETVIAPGHGPMTTVAHERRFNPFVV